MNLNRYKLILEYDGLGFAGWQKQVHAESVQSILEKAILNLTNEFCRVYGAGRTDAGVHATHQVAHFDSNTSIDRVRLAPALNYFVRPYPLCIVDVAEVDTNFHARFSAISRSYVYKILNRSNPSVLLRDRAWHIRDSLNVKAMQQAAQILVGQHDFTSFRSSRCQAKSAIRRITDINIYKLNHELIEVHITAPSFLHNQVRITVGSLKKVGEGIWTKEDILSKLQAKDRTLTGPTAPAHGLYLVDVKY